MSTSPKKPRRQVFRPSPNATYAFHVIGGSNTGFRDLYHRLLRMPWWQTLTLIVSAFLLINLVFAFGYYHLGGVANARPGSLEDAYYFSVETMATIGYGSLYPASRAANVLMVIESILGLVSTALMTGLMFVKFSLTRGRILFSKCATVSPVDGMPTLMIRLGNERTNTIFNAEMRLTLSRTTRTLEGQVIYRASDLKLIRERATSLARAWTAMHVIDDSSPLKTETPESLRAADAEIVLSVAGTDDTSLQPIHGRHMYEATDIVFGARLADILKELPSGDMELHLDRFHDVEPTPKTPFFPWGTG